MSDRGVPSEVGAREFDFFVSRDGADRGWAEWIAWQIEEFEPEPGVRYRVLLQNWDFVPGADWAGWTEHEIGRATMVIPVLSPDYLTGQRPGAAEWWAFWRSDPHGRERRILPVRVRPCAPEGPLGQIFGVDLVGVPEPEAIERLRAAILATSADRRGQWRPAWVESARAVPRRPNFPGDVVGPAIAGGIAGGLASGFGGGSPGDGGSPGVGWHGNAGTENAGPAWQGNAGTDNATVGWHGNAGTENIGPAWQGNAGTENVGASHPGAGGQGYPGSGQGGQGYSGGEHGGQGWPGQPGAENVGAGHPGAYPGGGDPGAGGQGYPDAGPAGQGWQGQPGAGQGWQSQPGAGQPGAGQGWPGQPGAGQGGQGWPGQPGVQNVGAGHPGGYAGAGQAGPPPGGYGGGGWQGPPGGGRQGGAPYPRHQAKPGRGRGPKIAAAAGVVVVALIATLIVVVKPFGEKDSCTVGNYITSVRLAGQDVAATTQKGSLPTGSADGPSVTVPPTTTVINGGSLQVPVAASGGFVKLLVGIEPTAGADPATASADCYYEINAAGAPTTQDLVVIIAQELPASAFTLSYAAVDDQGRQGVPGKQKAQAIQVATGEAQVSLSWDADSDVDLHVLDPNGEEVYFDSPTVASGGVLDLDSNADCEIDHKNNENIAWTTPPNGVYTVRVDYYDSCGVPETNYVVTVHAAGRDTQVFNGQLTGSGDAGRGGSGQEITTFKVGP